ncbi:MAG TPA: PPE domain-containing protein [Mycobacterium sp.]|nr:PPE domain-containing protein [Mycobacterium sp.]
MADPRWMSPPEVVAAIFEAGPGPASVLANQLVWVTEAISHELMTGLSAVNTAATAAEWIGGGGIASAQSALGLNTGLQTLVGWITHKVAVTQAGAEGFMLAASTVIPSLVSQTNRDETATLHATNFMGVNTPAIIERDTEYFGEHWPHNSSVGWSYSSLLTGLIGTLGVPPPVAPMGASPAAPAVAGTAAAQSAARAAQGGLQSAAEAPAQAASSTGGMTSEVGSVLQQGPQLLSAMTDPLKSFASAPTQALQGFSSAPQSLMGMFSAMRATDALGANATLTSAVSEPLRAGTGVATGFGGGAGGVGGYPGAALTNYTRPASTFSPENAGRPTGRAGVLNAVELRGPTSSGMGGTPMPMSPATGMLGRANDGGERDEAARARIVVDSDRADPSAAGHRT